jgi:replication factor C subunit 3/5
VPQPQVAYSNVSLTPNITRVNVPSVATSVIEKYTSSTRFCMICNYVGKISPALQSRCTRFRFSPLGEEQIEPRLKFVASAEKLNYTEDGMAACIKLANGDMRKCLNVLQASAMSFEIINEDAIYTCTGNPLPSDMEEALGWLLNEDFKTARKNLLELKLSKGLALTDLLREIYNYGSLIEFPDQAKMFFFNRLAQIEYNVSLGTDENLQLSAVVGIFQHIKEMCED